MLIYIYIYKYTERIIKVHDAFRISLNSSGSIIYL